MDMLTHLMKYVARNRAGRLIDVRTGRFVLTVTTRRGHCFAPSYVDARTNDWQCVHCGRTGHFDYILDYRPCEPV